MFNLKFYSPTIAVEPYHHLLPLVLFILNVTVPKSTLPEHHGHTLGFSGTVQEQEKNKSRI